MAIGFSTAAARHSDSSDNSLFSSALRVRADRPENSTLSSAMYVRRNSYMASSSTSYDRREIASLTMMMVLLITLSFLLLSLAPCDVIEVYETYPQKLRSIFFPSPSVRKRIKSQIDLSIRNSSRMDHHQEKKEARYNVAEPFNNEYLQNIAHVERLIHQEISEEENMSRHEMTYAGVLNGREGFQLENSQELKNISGYERALSMEPRSISHFFKLRPGKEEVGGVNIIKGHSIAVRGLFETNDQRTILQFQERGQNMNSILERIYMEKEREQTDNMSNDQTIMKKKRQQIKNIVATLRKAGMFAMVATRIEAMDLLSLPQMTTIFVPTDSAFDIFMNASNAYIPDHLLLYHIAVPRYTFEDLCGLKKRDRLTAYLMGCKIIVTEKELFNYTLDDVRIISPDLYMDDSVVVHGINGVLNYTKFCNVHDTIPASSPEINGSSTSSNITNPGSNLPITTPLLPNANGSTSLPSTSGSSGSFNGAYSEGFTHIMLPLVIRSMGFAGMLLVSFSYIILGCWSDQ